jgi:tetratricopeptide (TPR) repeat protein
MKDRYYAGRSNLIWFLFPALVFFTSAQNPNDTSGVTELRNRLVLAYEQNDSLQLTRTYRSIGVEFMYASMIDTAFVYLEKALAIARALDHPRAIAAITNNLAECYSRKGDNPKALELYDEVGSIYLSIPDSVGYAGFLINLAAEMQEMGETSRAIRTALEAVRIKEGTGDVAQLAFYYNKVAELLEFSNPESHREWLKKAYGLIQDPAYTSFSTNITIYNNMAKYHRDRQEYDMALAFYDSVYQVARLNHHQDGMEVGMSNLAMLHALMGDTVKALERHKQAIQISEKGQNVYRRTGHYINAGRFEIVLGNYQAAIPLLKQGLEYAHAYSFPEYRKEALFGLSTAYQSLQQWEKAFDAFQQYYLVKDSLEGVQEKAIILELEQQYERQRREQQIELLTTENEFNIKRRRILSALLVISIFLFLSIAIIVRLRYNRLRQQKELAEQKEDNYRLSQENLKLTLDQKNRELSSMAMQMAQKTEFLHNIKKELSHSDAENLDVHIRKIDNQINRNGDWDNFRFHFEEVHPDFFRTLRTTYRCLTANEEKLCAFIKMNLSTKEISLINNNTTAAVDKSRNRLRKKLALTPDQDLKTFLDSI